MIDSQALSKISAVIQEISTDDIPKSWWMEFSSWRDFQALLRTRTVLLIHKVVKNMRECFKNLQDYDVTIDAIDENGNIEIVITEHKDGMFQGFIVKAKRKRLRRLREIAAFNLAQHLVSETNAESLIIPKTLIHLVNKLANTRVKLHFQMH